MLTVLDCKNARPKEKPYKLADGQGMYLEVSPTGSRYWRLKYRFAGKEKRLALGVFPAVSLAKAREERDKARQLLAEGIDPGALRKVTKTMQADRAANSFEAIAREWYAKHSPGWSTSHSERVISRLEHDAFPWLGNRPIAEITAPELLATIRRVEGRGTLETAHRVLQYCGQVFRYSIATGRAERDITGDLRGSLPPTRPKSFASITEPKAIGELLRAINGYQGGLIVKSALRLAPLVFVRPGELRHAEWAHIDLGAAEWRFIVSKTKTPHIVPLSTQAVAILRELQPLTGHARYLFPSNRGEGKAMSENTVNAALRYLGFDGDTMTGHGFRAMARTVLDEVLGFPPHIIEQQLAHAVKDPLGRAYNRTSHLQERQKMMQSWADYLDKIAAGAEVLPFYRVA